MDESEFDEGAVFPETEIEFVEPEIDSGITTDPIETPAESDQGVGVGPIPEAPAVPPTQKPQKRPRNKKKDSASQQIVESSDPPGASSSTGRATPESGTTLVRDYFAEFQEKNESFEERIRKETEKAVRTATEAAIRAFTGQKRLGIFQMIERTAKKGGKRPV
jgi:hypothetical protein